jgi:hypothetical protein
VSGDSLFPSSLLFSCTPLSRYARSGGITDRPIR